MLSILLYFCTDVTSIWKSSILRLKSLSNLPVAFTDENILKSSVEFLQNAVRSLYYFLLSSIVLFIRSYFVTFTLGKRFTKVKNFEIE